MSQNEKPVYLAPASEPFIRDFDETFNRFAAADMHTLTVTVDTYSVYEGDIAMLQELIMALQHQPHLIEKLLFCLEIKFTLIENSGIHIPAASWKTEKAYYRWFHKLSASPMMIFFLNDEDARFYLLAGDMLADDLLEVATGERGKGMAALEGEELVEVLHRLFAACWMMLIYCHGSGFNPEPYIQSLLADLGLPLTYEQVYAKYLEDIEKGISFRATSIA
ncbi:MAG: hypothetical protein ABI594_13455 [Ginsengibacter sp.]